MEPINNTVHDESDFEFTGEYRCPKQGEYFRGQGGNILGPSPPRDFAVVEAAIMRKKERP